MGVVFGVLGPVTAWDGSGDVIALKGPKHRAVLARLIVARGRVVPVTRLVDDLWGDPPDDGVGAVRTFVAALRRALEPDRPPRAPSRMLVTEGPGYALRVGPDGVDAWRFEQVVGASRPAGELVERLDEALGWWRGPAYAEFADEGWARAERSRLAELRLRAVERKAEAKLELGRAAEVVPDLDAHVTEHPWREDAWRLLAFALYRSGRQRDALAVLRRARALLAEQLGLDPGPALRRLEEDILRQADHMENGQDAAARVWAEAAAAYDRAVASGARARLESTVGILRNLAMTGGGGLVAAREQRTAAIAAAEELGDAELTARVIGAYDVPAIWTRSDDPRQAAEVVAVAERTLGGLAEGNDALRARLLATVALESRGDRSGRGRAAALEAERIARGLDDPGLLAFALNGVYMQTFQRAGLAPERDGIGAELVGLSRRHGLVAFEVLGHLVRVQARSALGDFAGADRHAVAADELAARHERPLVNVFTQWYRALQLAASSEAGADADAVKAAYEDAIARLDGAGMPGLESGLPALARLCLRLRQGLPAQTDAHIDWGPYEPWARPLVWVARGRTSEAVAALRRAPEPPRDLLFEAMWCLTAKAAIAVDDRETMRRAHGELAPAAAELGGAGSGLITLGPVSRYLDDLSAALGRS
ncbi:SARP family transcriptional regulator [Actinomadura sp. KC216]|uniref:AfsR/SARP family transcriptional regulator n=1 Tax=Actinomadura sp. KC216 TaxID=2530370 RepID=UPI0010451B60|nr:BTAD domain-containing putative transcriptional regulator [Actinomadura sp. KC216]TDB88175.1 SARP family transcriptional regulator [Actinomadura sp. KC216]